MAVSDWSGGSLPWVEELATLKERIGALFGRAEPRRQVGLLLEGLIGGVERKNGWQLAEYAGDAAPWRMQGLLGRTLWDQEKARDICRDFVIERLGDPTWRSKRRPDLGRDGVCEEGQPFGRGCASIQRHSRTC